MRNAKVSFILVLSILLSPAVRADYGYADSPEFELNLLSLPLGGAYDYADSSQFTLNLYPVNRAWADSGEFAYDWLANCNLVYGPLPYSGQAPQNNFLMQLSGDSWVNAFSTPAEDSTVIIINHGWNSSPDVMLDLAKKIASEIPSASIYSWDWGDGPNAASDANPNGKGAWEDFAELLMCTAGGSLSCLRSSPNLGLELQKTIKNAYSHGTQLGNTLVSYGIIPSRHKIHMIGHSFGGIVCAEAAKKLYAASGAKVKQLTTLDTPALGWFHVNAVKAINADTFERVEVLYYDWRDELLLGATGGPIGNYENVLNLELNPSFHAIFPLHTKSVDWYETSVPWSVLNCEDNRYGFGWSFAWSPLDPYWDILGNQKEVWGYGQGCISMSAAVEAVTEIVFDTVKEDFASAAEWVGDKAEVVMDNVGNVVNSAIKLTVFIPPILPLAEGQMAALTEQGEPNEAYIYTTLQIPADAEQVVFDLRFESVSPGDVLTFSIGNQVLITIDAESVGISGDYTQSYPASVWDYAGQTVSVQFTLRPAGQGTTSVLIDNLRFVKVTIPGDFDGNKAVDLADLAILCDQWMLNPSIPSADLAPAPAGDNVVNIKDFQILAENWQVVIPQPDPNPDISGNAEVDIEDFAILAAQWQNPCVAPDWCDRGDIDRSGLVDLEDLVWLVQSWLNGTSL